MKSQEIKALKDKSPQELLELVKTLGQELITLQLEKTHTKGKNVHLSKEKKDHLARVLTTLRRKELSV